MMMFRKKILMAAMIVTVPALMSNTALAKKVTLKLAHNLDQAHVVHKATDYFVKDLKKRSDGEVVIRIYPNGQMGSPRENLEMLQNNALDMTKVNSSELESFIPEFAVFNLPYLFKDDAHLKRVLYGKTGDLLEQKAEEHGVKIIATYVGGTRSFYAKKPLKSPEDLKGLKIRVISTPTTNKLIELLGATPVSVPLGEVYTAIQQGVVDGAENNIPSYYQTRHVEVAKYYSIDSHTSMPDYLVVSLNSWKKLSPEQQKLVIEAAQASEKYQNDLWDKETEHDRQESEKLGAEFIEVDKEPFKKALQPMYQEFGQDAKLKPVIESVQAAANEG